MPRILVADDNSNIHRTVALALKEAGVEVVAVGNGEAAVRKIAEIKPDLVLADIFMPVRSGYEVCEFVKQDPRFHDIPVVLLIGAFDPFDEREAQRVHADAILKKPFVPPDSLLRTVADLLALSASRMAPAAAKSAQAAPPVDAVPGAGSQEYADEAPEEFALAKPRMDWDSANQPVAFGSLLETPSGETDATEISETPATDDSVMTAQRDPTLGEPAFWAPTPQAEAQEENPESNESPAESPAGMSDEEQWRSAGGLELPSMPAPQGSSHAFATESLIEPLQQEPSLELPELPNFAAPANQVASDLTHQIVIAHEAAHEAAHKAVEPLSNSAPQLPEFPSLDPSPFGEFTPHPALASISEAPVAEDAATSESAPEAKDFSWATPRYRPEPSVPQSEFLVEEGVEEGSPASEDELVKAAAPGLATLAPFLASLTSSASARGPEQHASLEDLDPLSAFPADPQLEAAVADTIAQAGRLDPDSVSQLDSALIEAIAQRVIERMQPKIIELVTRELLRPAVEALVQRELEKK